MPTTGKVITCKAAVTKEPGAPFVLETVQVAPPKAGEVRIKITSTGVCHSDLHIMEGIDKSFPFPCVLGHEGAGIVESVGEGVKSVKPGDTVVLLFEGYCGECEFCKNPNTNQCQKQPRNALQLDGTSRITLNGEPLAQMAAISTFTEYTVTAEMNVTKVNPKANPNKIGLAGCCIPTGYGAAMKCAKVPAGSTCAIWGLGGVGMNVVMGCRDSLASKVIGVDVNPDKFALAKELGCTDIFNPKDHDDVPAALAALTNGGPDYCFVSVGSVPVMEQAFNSSHPQWGTTVLIGLSNIGETMRAGVWEMLYGRSIKGTYYGSYKAKLEIPELVDKVVNGEIQLDKIISHIIPLSKINEGFNMLKTGESIRTIIDMDLKG